MEPVLVSVDAPVQVHNNYEEYSQLKMEGEGRELTAQGVVVIRQKSGKSINEQTIDHFTLVRELNLGLFEQG